MSGVKECGACERSPLKLCADCIASTADTATRHPKWVRVEPGTVIPAGQPYRTEYPKGYAEEDHFRSDSRIPLRTDGEWFIDSTWSPPLELPIEPTWGIALYYDDWHTALWAVEGDRLGDCRGEGTVYSPIKTSEVTEFIPFTPEQVARIEANA